MHPDAVEGPQQRSAEWYAMRNKVFGASEAAALCGLDSYRTTLDLYLDKVNEEPPIPDNQNMLIGRCMEPAILDIYSAMEEVNVRRDIPAYYLPADSYPLLASLDGQREDTGQPVEAKFTASPQQIARLGEEGSDWVPISWLMQVQAQMNIAAGQRADIAVFVSGKMRIYHIDRNDDLIQSIEVAAREMRERIANHDPPPLDFEHARALDAVKRQFSNVVDNLVVFSPDQSRRALRYFDVADQIKVLEKEKAQLQAELLEAMGEASEAQIPGDNRVIRRTMIGEQDIKAFKKKAHVRLSVGKARKTKE